MIRRFLKNLKVPRARLANPAQLIRFKSDTTHLDSIKKTKFGAKNSPIGVQNEIKIIGFDQECDNVTDFFSFVEKENMDFTLNELITLLNFLSTKILPEDSSTPNMRKAKQDTIENENLTKGQKKILKSMISAVKIELDLISNREHFHDINFNEVREEYRKEGKDFNEYLERWTKMQIELDGEDEYFIKFPRLGSLCQSLADLGVNDKNVYSKITDMIGKEKYASSFDEARLALEGLVHYSRMVPLDAEVKSKKITGGVTEEKKMIPGRRSRTVKLVKEAKNHEPVSDSIKLQKAVLKLGKRVLYSIRDENQLSYLSVAKSLHHLMPVIKQETQYTPLYQNLVDKLYEKLENQIFRNLGMEYSSQTILDTMHYFALEGQGSLKFYEALQIVMVKGKMFSPNIRMNSSSSKQD